MLIQIKYYFQYYSPVNFIVSKLFWKDGFILDWSRVPVSLDLKCFRAKQNPNWITTWPSSLLFKCLNNSFESLSYMNHNAKEQTFSTEFFRSISIRFYTHACVHKIQIFTAHLKEERQSVSCGVMLCLPTNLYYVHECSDRLLLGRRRRIFWERFSCLFRNGRASNEWRWGGWLCGATVSAHFHKNNSASGESWRPRLTGS